MQTSHWGGGGGEGGMPPVVDSGHTSHLGGGMPLLQTLGRPLTEGGYRLLRPVSLRGVGKGGGSP